MAIIQAVGVPSGLTAVSTLAISSGQGLSPTTPGNAIVVVMWSHTTTSVNSIVDSASNGYTSEAGVTPNSALRMDIFVAVNTASASSITLSTSSSGAIAAFVFEIS